MKNEDIDVEQLQADIAKCTLRGHDILLPTRYEQPIENYHQLKSVLRKAGGQYHLGRFRYQSNKRPKDVVKRIMNMGQKPQQKQQYESFSTPPDLAIHLLIEADIQAGDRVLEPSAGKGAILKAIKRVGFFDPDSGKQIPEPDYCEIYAPNHQVCDSVGRRVANDFMRLPLSHKYDRIIAFPPYSESEAVYADHISKMVDHLWPGGRLVCLAPVELVTDRKVKPVRQKIEGAMIYPLEEEAFKAWSDRSFVIVVWNKPRFKTTVKYLSF